MKIKRNCLQCNKEIFVEQKEVNRGYGKFCNRNCSAKFNGKQRTEDLKPNVTCAFCDKKFYKNLSGQQKSKSGLYFCCREHKDLAQCIGGIQEIMPDHYGTGKNDDCRVYRRIAFLHKKEACERCGYNQHKAALVIHHKDRNRLNIKIDNLEVLCANCHAIEHWGKEEEIKEFDTSISEEVE